MTSIISLGRYSGGNHNLEVLTMRISYTMRLDIGGGVLFDGEVTDLSAVPFTGTSVTASLTPHDDGSVGISWLGVNVQMEPA